MSFSDTTNLDGIIQDCEDKIKMGDGWISGNPTRMMKFTRYANQVLSAVWHNIFMVYSGWQFDDSNHTDLPQAATDASATVSKYALPDEGLTVKRIDIKDAAGNWIKELPLYTEKIEGAVTDFMGAAGVPRGYRLVGKTIEFFPAFSYDSNEGIKVYFDREMTNFLTTDTTKAPGFASAYHEIVPTGMAMKWLKINNPKQLKEAGYENDYAVLMKNIKEFYAGRFEDAGPGTIRFKQENFE